MLRYVLLAVIAESGPLHGYALMKTFAARSGIRLSIGNIYRELQRLRTDGHIQAVENPADADPRRAPYRITDAGRAAVTAWLAMPAESFLKEPVDPLYCRLVLLANCEPSDATSFLRDLEAELSLRSKSAERRRLTAVDASPLLRIVLGRRTRHLAADMDMVAEMRTALSTIPPRRSLRPRRQHPNSDSKRQNAEGRRATVRVGR